MLQEELRARDLVILDVATHYQDPTVLIVYLHGLSGQYVNGWAKSVVESVPGVRAVAESVRTPAIILAWIEADHV